MGTEKHGEYMVKSAYTKLAETHTPWVGLSPRGSGDGPWKRIWKLNVPPKVKVFLVAGST
jgi:hypothetical protein